MTADFRAELGRASRSRASRRPTSCSRSGRAASSPRSKRHVVGMNAGEEQDVPVDAPRGLPDEELAGKTVDFTITLKEIKEKVLPPLTDEWASEVSEFATLLELRLEIREQDAGAARPTPPTSASARWPSRPSPTTPRSTCPTWWCSEQAEEMLADFKRSLEVAGWRPRGLHGGHGHDRRADDRGPEARGGQQREDRAGAGRGGQGRGPRSHRRRGQRGWSPRWPRPAGSTPRRSRPACARLAGSRPSSGRSCATRRPTSSSPTRWRWRRLRAAAPARGRRGLAARRQPETATKAAADGRGRGSGAGGRARGGRSG